jgi:cytochrome c-type biogenesis protein CcmF
MNQIQYTGEHLWVGQIGHFLLVFSFVAALLSAVSYFISAKNEKIDTGIRWSALGNYAFYAHGTTLISFMALLFYAMYHHMNEYSYVFDHVSADLPLKYILSAFWEGQEGSFMLWMFWHIILGFILVKKSGELQAPVMFTIAIAETILMSMLLGIHIPWGDSTFKIGSNPITLLRQINDAPIFSNADYLSLIKGRGMNPLLQNYWMTIHPPTLFLGFASTIVPFGFAFAGLWKNDHKIWMRKALPWALFSAGILGTGILMGSLWAYVALSFGGYWAWDPVENASLVPWITLIAGIHTHLVSKNTGHATRSVYIFYLISFVLVLYSTYLTRSGILGDTSAHAFTEMGLDKQLILMILAFTLPSVYLFFKNSKNIPVPPKEEELPSREFWMFIGSLVLLFSAILISTSTSLPVINKIIGYFNTGYEGKVVKNAIEHYNKYQMWIAVFVAILSSIAIFLRYKAINEKANRKKFITTILLLAVAAILLTWITTFWLNLYAWQYVVLCVAGYFSVVSNIYYMAWVLKGNIKLAWSAIAHFGFGMMVIGILSSGLNQKSISSNPFVFQEIFSAEDLAKYVQLFKGKPLFSQGYFITYQSDTLVGRERRYSINFKKINDSLEITDQWTLYPNAVYSNDFSKVAAFNPDTKHYLHKDVFTCVVALPPSLQSAEEADKIEKSLVFSPFSVPLGDTLQFKDFIVKPVSVNLNPQNVHYIQAGHDVGIGVMLNIYDINRDTSYDVEAALGIDEALVYQYPASIPDLELRIKLDEKMFDAYFTADDQLEYKDYVIKNGGTISVGGKTIHLKGFDKEPVHPKYKKEEKDIAIGANLRITDGNIDELAKPLYVIRDNLPMSIKHYSVSTGLHVRFSNINPATEEFTFKVALDKPKPKNVSLLMATDVPRDDYLVLQATVFPGINLFWTGSILMMLALFMAGWQRSKTKHSQDA